MQWWIGKVPTCRSHIDNNNNQARDHNKLVKENADRITCWSNLYNTYNRAMDRMEHRGRMVTKSPAATAGLIYIHIQPLSKQRDEDYPLLDPECTFFTANPLFSSPTSSLELVFRTDLSCYCCCCWEQGLSRRQAVRTCHKRRVLVDPSPFLSVSLPWNKRQKNCKNLMKIGIENQINLIVAAAAVPWTPLVMVWSRSVPSVGGTDQYVAPTTPAQWPKLQWFATAALTLSPSLLPPPPLTSTLFLEASWLDSRSQEFGILPY